LERHRIGPASFLCGQFALTPHRLLEVGDALTQRGETRICLPVSIDLFIRSPTSSRSRPDVPAVETRIARHNSVDGP
jgi:hypothetical protein